MLKGLLNDCCVAQVGGNKNSFYMVLHRATCLKVSDYNDMAKPGGFTERSYIKVCATDVEDLRVWTTRNGRPDGSFSKECSFCTK